MSDLLTDGIDRPSGPGGFWGNLHPSIRSGLIVSIFLIAIGLVNLFTVGSSIVFCYPIQILLYMANGALGAHFALDSGYSTSDLPRVGALAALIGWVGPTIFYLVVNIFFGLVTLGVAFVGLLGCVLCGPIDLAIHAAFGALGAYIYGRYRGPTPDPSYF